MSQWLHRQAQRRYCCRRIEEETSLDVFHEVLFTDEDVVFGADEEVVAPYNGTRDR